MTQTNFDAIVGHLIAAMKQQQVSISTRNALLAKLAPMYSDITYHWCSFLALTKKTVENSQIKQDDNNQETTLKPVEQTSSS